MQKLPLLKIYTAFILTGMLFAASLDQYSLFAPANLSFTGFLAVLASRFGVSIGWSLWAFLPIFLYRIYIWVSKKTYSKKTDQNLLIFGLVLIAIAIKGLTG